ncbi:hypothetical protein DRQ09_01715 [candidate division KSB1 bacterium]|nr:MAG: hypothetical protein DRQ09_01715 [candidate division KSB1 bacterium]
MLKDPIKLFVIFIVIVIVAFNIWLKKTEPEINIEGKTTLTIVISTVPRDQIYWNMLLSEFERENPDIYVNAIRTREEKKVQTMVAGGVAPDLIQIEGQNMGYWIQAKALLDITQWLKKDEKTFDIKDIYDISLQAFTYKGKIYGLPFGIVPFVLFYNKDLFRKYNIPFPDETWTWEDIRKYGKILTNDFDGDGINDEIGIDMNIWSEGLYTFIYQNGGRILNEQGTRIDMTDPRTVEAIKFVYDLIHKDRIVKSNFNMVKGVFNIRFQNGSIGMIVPGGSFWITEFREYKELDWDIAPLPAGPAGRATTIAPGGWGISSQSKHPEEAYRLLKFIAGKKGQEIMAKSGLFIPCRKSVCHSELFLRPVNPETGERYKHPEHVENLIKDLDEGYAKLPVWTSPRWPLVRDLLNRVFYNLLMDPKKPGENPEKVCKDFTRQANQILIEAEKHTSGKKIPWRYVLSGMVLFILIPTVFLWKTSRKRKKAGYLLASENRWGYIMISPWIVGFVIFFAGPLLFSIFLSFCQWLSLGPPETARFVGLDNYTTMFNRDPDFSKSLLVTSYYSILFVPLGLIFGLLLALLMNVEAKGMRGFRTIYFLPAVLPSVAVAVLWKDLFRQTGYLNLLLQRVYNFTLGLFFGKISISNLPNWLYNADFTVPAIVIMSLWGVGGGMMIYLAGLRSIPVQLYESAEIDGANRFNKFWHITLPQLSPVIFFNLVMGIISSFQVFTQAYMLFSTEGQANRAGPDDSALFYVLNLYQQAFEQFKMGYASALAWILFFIILIFTLLVFKTSSLWVYYEVEKGG